MRIQLSFIKAGIRDMRHVQKYNTVSAIPFVHFVLENMVIFFNKNTLCMATCTGFTIVILK